MSDSMKQIKEVSPAAGAESAMDVKSPALASRLNQDCLCQSVDQARLAAVLASGGVADYAELRATRPHLFSETVVFVDEANLQAMARIITAIESVVAMPAYQAQVLAWAGPMARQVQGARGVFMGYDFHLSPDGPKLIEINTNAGGGLLAASLAQAQQVCCPEMAHWRGPQPVAEAFVAMFREEWRLARGDQALTRIAIVDTDPASQYLAPEFELFRRLLEAHGIAAVVADPAELHWDGQTLSHQGQPVDMVYKRLTDFALEAPIHGALRAAYEAGGVVLTPHPRAHALYADKRNLMLLCDGDWLATIGVDEATRATLLAGVPRTVQVAAERADEFWSQRRRWFFKPAAGFGSRAAYRGDKLTKRVFEEILARDYIAQEIVPPSERRVAVHGQPQEMKVDLRNYVYNGQVQLVAARLYQGQTTNFRTPGGGFASVVAV